MRGPWSAQGAYFTPNRRYRYRLWREWDEQLPRSVFVLLHPSYGDGDVLDPVAAKCVEFARSWGCGSVDIVCAFGLVTLDPTVLRQRENPVGTHNDEQILDVLRGLTAEDTIVAAWTHYAAHMNRAAKLLEMLKGLNLKCLGTNVEGYPLYPEFLPLTQPLQAYPP